MAAREPLTQANGLRIIRWVLGAKATSGTRSPHFWIIGALLGIFAYVYYYVLSAMHDVYLVLFFYPQLYAAITYRLRGVLISSIVLVGIVLPYALLISSDPFALVKLLLFSAFAFLFNGLGATLLNYLERQLEAYKEIVSLNEELSNSIKRLETAQRQLVQSEKLNAIGELAASVAHEINNPLAGVLVYSKLMAKKVSGGTLSKEETLSNLAKIEAAVGHCSGIIRGLLDFARQSEPVFGPVTLGRVVDQVMTLVGHQAGMNKVEVVREDEPLLLPVLADFRQLQQVLINLFVNAVQAMPNGGRLTLRTAPWQNGWVKISVRDTGTGISPENLDKIFTPFFTTKAEGKGVGLGLAVSYGIIERHHGRIEVESEVGKGSTFTVYLPGAGNNEPTTPALY